MSTHRSARRASFVKPINTTLAQLLQPLESRSYMAMSLDGNGFTVVTPSSDTKTVFVSSSNGSDSNDGSSASEAVKTLSKGVSLLRDGSPDHLLLKRGDEWKESFTAWTKSGKDADEPMLVGAFGTGDRPHLKVMGSKNGFFSNKTLHDVAVIGIEFDAASRNTESSDYVNQDGSYGIQLVGPSSNMLFEDLSVHHFKYNASFTGYSGYQKNIKVRNSAITDAYDGTKSQGLYGSLVDGLTLDGNVFDHNGWNEKLGVPATEFSHNIYLWQNTRNVVVRNNIIADAASHGIQARGGGIIENNVFVRNPIHALLGNGSTVTDGGVTGRISGNMFIESRAIGTSVRGWAIELGNIRDGAGAVVRDNIITQDTQNKFPAIKLQPPSGATNYSDAVGLNDVLIEQNIVYKWFQGMGFASGIVDGGTGAASLNDLTVRDNDFQATSSQKIINHWNALKTSEETWQDNTYYTAAGSLSGWFSIQNSAKSFDAWQDTVEPTAVNEQVKYPDPGRTVGSYNASIGGTNSRDSFLDKAAENNETDFDARYTAKGLLNYLRAGFTGAMPNGPSTPTPDEPTTPTPPTGDSSKPTATLSSASDRSASGTSSHQIKVTYVDDVAVQVNSIGNTDITVTGPNGYTQAATLAKLDYSTNGKTRVATYNVTAPGGSWDTGDNGVYTVKMNTIGVRDTEANYVAAGTLGTFDATVGVADDEAPAAPAPTPVTPPASADTTPPSVVWSNFDPATQTVMVKFNEDVSNSLNTGDLRLKNTKTGELITYSSMTLTYDKNTNTATWAIDAQLAADASYKVMLSAPVVSDGSGNKLDGNGDGTGGDDHVFYISASEIAAINLIASSDPLAPTTA